MGSVRVADSSSAGGRSFDLGIDTASDDASLALFPLGDDRPLGVHTFSPETTMSRELIGEIARFLAEAGVERSEVGRIAVTTGPYRPPVCHSEVATSECFGRIGWVAQ